MIPIRVPADARPRTAGTVHTLQPDDPLTRQLCPVCDEPFADRPIVLVHVGSAPREHKTRGWVTGSAVAVHGRCAYAPAAATKPVPGLAAELLDALKQVYSEDTCEPNDHGTCDDHGWHVSACLGTRQLIERAETAGLS